MAREIKIKDTKTSFWVEPIAGTFGFAGGTMAEIWQAVYSAQTSDEHKALVAGTQNPLWCYKPIFDSLGEDDSNALMYNITAKAASISKGKTFTRPDLFLHEHLQEIHDYSKKITENPNLPLTFTLNALVAWDWAHWVLYKQANFLPEFDSIIPKEYRDGLVKKANKLSVIPLMSYSKTKQDIIDALNDGYVVMKLKIGHVTPYTQTERGSKRDLDTMLECDKNRLKMLHNISKDRSTDLTKKGRIPYYLDANGRYDEEHLKQLLDYADQIGALERIMILEEPIADMKIDWRQYPKIIAADECAHSVEDVKEQIQRGVRYIALKPAAKTPSVTFEMIKAIYKHNSMHTDESYFVYPFVADLTVYPPLIHLDAAVAARLPLLPGMNVPVFETNFHQHYRDTERLLNAQIRPKASWARHKNGMYDLSGKSYEQTEGGIFDPFPIFRKDVGELVKIK